MKRHTTTLAALLLSTASLTALADINPTTPAATTQTITTAQQNPGKTRAQVYQELIEARRQGLIPTPDYDYPPSQRTIENNKIRNQIVERYWASQDEKRNHSNN